MGSSLLFSSTEKKNQNTIVAGSSATINKPGIEGKDQPGKEASCVSTQPKSSAIAIKRPMSQPKIAVSKSTTTMTVPQPKPTSVQPATSSSVVKKPVIMVQTPKKTQPVRQEAAVDEEPPQSQEQTQPSAEEPEDDGIVLGVELVKEATAVLSKVVPKRASISVLEYVKMESVDSRVRLTGTDLEKSVVIDVPYSNKTERLKSPLAISLEDLKRLSKVKARELRFGRENGNVLVSYATDRGGRNEVLRKVDLTEFPEIPLPKGEFKPVKGLGLALSEAVKFCADEIGRYALTGILLTEGEVASSDGKRLYRRLVPDLKQNPSVIIPSSKFFGLKQLAQNEVGVFVGKEIAWLKMGNVLWGGRIVEGNYPEYGKVIPESCENGLTLTEETKKALVEIISSLPYADNNPALKIEFKQEGNGWKILFTTAGENPATAELQDIEYQGGEAWFGINPDYLVEALEVSGVMMMGFNGPENPIVIFGDEVTTLTMPLMASAFEPRQTRAESEQAEENGEEPSEEPVEGSGEETPEGEQEPEEVIEEAHQEG